MIDRSCYIIFLMCSTTAILLLEQPAQALAMAALENFEPLGNGTSIYRPTTVAPNSSNSPSLIIIATWFSALPRHVSKYTSTYQKMFPNAAILLLSTTIPDMVYRSYSTQQKNLVPALPIIQEYSQRRPDQEILFHIFSNSGAHTACQLARAYRNQTGVALNVGALIIDSAPGINTYRGITTGFIGGLPSNPLVKIPLSVMVYALVGLITLKEWVTGEDHFIRRLRTDLNDQMLFREGRRPRVYVYSREDRVVGWRDVETHADEALALGLGNGGGVGRELWSGSGHVGHAARDGERYWGVVRKVWEAKSRVKAKL